MSRKPPNPEPQLEILHDTGTPDPIDVIPRSSIRSRNASPPDMVSDSSPPVRALKGKRLMRQPPPDEWSSPTDVDSGPSPPVRALTGRRSMRQPPPDAEWSSPIDVDSGPSPPVRALTGRHSMRQPAPQGPSDEEWSPPINRPLDPGGSLEQSPESYEGDSSGALLSHATSGHDDGGKLDFEASGSDTEEATSNSIPRPPMAELPRAVSPDVATLFGDFAEGPSSLPPPSSPEPETQPEEPSSEEEDKPLFPVPPPPRVWHYGDGTSAVLVPARDKSKYPLELREAEKTMASQIASALSDPRDEGLGSATFQTLLDTFLLPRLKGQNSKGQRVKVHQYSQLAARRNSPEGATARDNARADLDTLARMFKLDADDAENLRAVAKKRVPDMTSMAIFEKEELTDDGLNYRLTTCRGPKMCITEIKSFKWGGEPDVLHHALAVAVERAHKQNYVAAQFLFIEDEFLKHVASFVGVGPAWLYGEWHRTQYPDLHGIPLPRNPAEMRRYSEREAIMSPEHAEPSRKRQRVDSSGDESEQPPPGPRTRASAAIIRAEGTESEQYLHKLGSTPWSAPDDIKEIFTRRRPGEMVWPKKKGAQPMPYLHVLDPDGRTYEAFDAITERIRGWFTDKECHRDYKITFDEDPYAGGSCPATVAKMEAEARE